MSNKPVAKTLTLLNSAQMDKSIKSIQLRGAKLEAEIHHCAVSALSHFEQHGDITLLNRLIVALPKSARTNALVAWSLHFGNVAQNTDKSSRALSPLLKATGSPSKAFKLEEAHSTPFWSFKATEGTPTWSYDTYSASLIKSLTGAISKAVDASHKEALTAALSALQGQPKAIVSVEPENATETV